MENKKTREDGIEPIPVHRNTSTIQKDNVSSTITEKNKRTYEQGKKNSVKEIKIDYNPTKKKINIRFFALALALLLGIASFLSYVVSIIKNGIDDSIMKHNIDKGIVYMLDSESEIANIIEYITYRVKDASNNHAYDTNELARRMMNIDVRYIDLIIYNAYDNMHYNRTKNMDELIKNLSNRTYGLETINPEIYYKLNGLYSFEDYLKDIGCVDENGDISLEKYNEYGKSLYELHEDALKNVQEGKHK